MAPVVRTTRRRTALALVGLWACTGAAYGCVVPFLVVYAARRGLSLEGIGLLSAVGATAGAAVQPLIGRLLDRTGRQRLLLTGPIIVAAVGYLLLGHVGGAAPLIACATMGGVGFYGSRVVIMAATMHVVESAERGATAFARYRLCPSAGYTLTGIGGGFLLGHVSFAALFTAGAALFLAAGLCGLSLRPHPAHHETSIPAGEEHLRTPELARRVLLTLALMALGYGFITSSSDTYLPLLMRHLHGSLGEVGLTGTLPALVEIPLMVAVGALADRFARAGVLALGMAVLPLRFVLYALVPTPLALLCVQTLDGFTFSVSTIVGLSVLSEHIPRSERAWALGIYSAAGTIGPIAGPVAAGALATRLGGLQPMFAVFALGAVAVPLTAAMGLWPLLRGVARSRQP